MQQQAAAAATGQQQRMPGDVPWYRELLEQLLPGALLMDYKDQQEPLLDAAAVVSLLRVVHEAQCAAKERQDQQQQEQQQQQQQCQTDLEKASLDAELLPMLLQWLLLKPDDLQLAHHVLTFAAAAVDYNVKAGHYSWNVLLPVLLQHVGPQVLRLLSSSRGSDSQEHLQMIGELHLALSRLVMLLTTPGRPHQHSAHQHAGRCSRTHYQQTEDLNTLLSIDSQSGHTSNASNEDEACACRSICSTSWINECRDCRDTCF
jgi:hypothetical protein